MKEFILNMLRLPGIIGRTGNLGFTPAFRRGLLRSHLRYMAAAAPAGGGIAGMAGYKVRYCNYASFRYLFTELFLNGEYNFIPETEAPVILDCGSNIGMSVLYFKTRYPDAQITAFEPDVAAFSCLRDNVAGNRLGGVCLNNKAVSGKDGHVVFWRDPDKEGALGNTICPNTPKAASAADSVRLSAYVKGRVDLLKLDVEGAEFEVLEDLSSSGKLGFIRQMIVEYHLHMPGMPERLSGFLGLLEAAGFGYQLGGEIERPFSDGAFQALHIYAYNKMPADK